MKLELQKLVVEKAMMPDLCKLKELSERLQLSSKRESVIQWHSELEELQSEGIYPATPRNNISTPDSSTNEPLNTNKNEEIREVSKSPTSIFTSESDEEQRDQVEDDYSHKSSSVKFRKFKKDFEDRLNSSKKPKNVASVSHRSVSLRSKKAKPSELGRQHHNPAEILRHRTTEECQDRIKKYTIRQVTDDITDYKIEKGEPSTIAERYERIGQALERIRTDLLDMRIQDNTLARQLLDGRHELNQVRAEKTWDEHANMLDDFSWELELEEELTEQLRSFDLPSAFLRKPDSLLRSSSPLRLIGISRMTMDSRRFSVI